MKVEKTELQLNKDNEQFFSGSFSLREGMGNRREQRKSKVGPLGLGGPEAQLPSISHTGQGHTERCASESGVGAGSLV